MAMFLYNEFEVLVTTPTISRALASAGWFVGITAAWDQKPGMNSSAQTVPSNPTDPTDPTDPTAEVKLQL